MHFDWLTENVNKFADWSKTKFLLVLKYKLFSIVTIAHKEMSLAIVTTNLSTTAISEKK